MDKQEIQAILDSLDVQIAMGRIDQATYTTLKQKWMQQLQELEQSNGVLTTPLPGNTGSMVPFTPSPATTAGETATSHVEVLACPKCGAPAGIEDTTQDLTKPVRCPFCDTVYTLRQGQDDTQQLKKELMAWFDKVVVNSGYNNANNVAITARRYIFSESVFPTLKKEIDRRLESFDNVLEAPMVQLKETTGFRDYQPGSLLLVSARGDNQWLKTLSARVSAPQLQSFAVVDDDKRKVQQLQLKVQSLIYYVNIAQQLALATSAAYQAVQQNVQALRKDYQVHINESDDERYGSFMMAQDARAEGVMLVLEILIGAFSEQHGLVPETTIGRLNQAIVQLEKALQLSDSCTYNPLYTVPLQNGIRKDITCTRILLAAVSSYEVVTRTRSEEFIPFYRRLMAYVFGLVRVQDAEHLLWMLTSICRVLQARCGDAPLPVLKDWQWVDAVVERQRQNGIFGLQKETASVVNRHYHPYWVARLSYSEVDGVVAKKAIAREGFLLVDAVSIDAPLVRHVTAVDASLSIVQAATQHFDVLDKEKVSLPALMTHAMAERAMKNYTASHRAGLKVLATRMVGIVYLPIVVARYSSKNSSRELVLEQIGINHTSNEKTLQQTQDFFQQYNV